MPFRSTSKKPQMTRVAFGTRQPRMTNPEMHTSGSPLKTIALFVLVPSLLLWTVLCLIVIGDVSTAVLVGCCAIAAGIVGWFVSLGRR
jgi:hypothetical protein